MHELYRLALFAPGANGATFTKQGSRIARDAARRAAAGNPAEDPGR